MFLALLRGPLLPLLRGQLLLLLLRHHFNLLNDVFHQQLEHLPYRTTSPSSRATPSSTACLLKKASSLPGGPPAARDIPDGPSTPAGLRAPAPLIVRLALKKPRDLHELRTQGRMMPTKVLNSACLHENHLGLACCKQSCSE